MVNWTADKDAILLVGIFEFVDIKFSKDLLEHLANKIGYVYSSSLGCTPKAVNHRLFNMKVKGKAAGGSAANTPTKAKPATPKTSGKGKGRGKAAPAFDGDANNPMDHDEHIIPPTPTKKRGRPKETNAESPAKKKIKAEENDEMGSIFGGSNAYSVVNSQEEMGEARFGGNGEEVGDVNEI
ncbi:uncharacterized protein BDR25DRAFT_311548 [Lindgomyces ingoldianus]|uniref:Uncharacterized protein n=1 Tax=Lindgomyces ingoldianus TaxID=673940 RepID=A0ACB6R502_9PLEO|nr:uncharacterized protein BDR25DRAFT_311548 [Lindgomyces ingoldianus]KAF2474165.1 hypothetical protein BDR25DRAFT_311548 [Lindgomyces ingoldianus]